MAPDDVLGQAQFAAERAHLVLEQLAQRLQQRHVHLFRQAAHIVVALDHARGAARGGHGLDHVGVQRALREKVEVAQLLGLRLEHVNEHRADGLALFLGVALAREGGKELILGVGINEVDVEVVAEHSLHQFGLALAQQPVVHEHAGEPVADGAVDERRGHARIDAAAQAAQHLLVLADLRADLVNGQIDKGAHVPVAGAAADGVHVVGEYLHALRRVHHLGVELHAVKAALRVGDDGVGRVLRAADGHEPLRQLLDPVAVAHPHLRARVHAVQKSRAVPVLQVGDAVFALVRAGNPPAEHVREQLHAVADAQNRHAQLKHPRVGVRRAGLVHAGRAAAEDDPHRVHRLQRRGGNAVRHNDAVHLRLAHPARNQLAVLGAEIEHHYRSADVLHVSLFLSDRNHKNRRH